MILFNHYMLFYLKWMDILNILMMVEKICHLLRMMKKLIKSITKYGKQLKKLLKVGFPVDPVRDDKYLVAKLKIFDRINRTTFNNNNNNNNSNNNNNNNNNAIPIETNRYIYIPAIDIDSVLKIDKRGYSQAYLEQCKYKLKTRKIVNYIDDEIIDEDSDSDIDDAVDSHLNFSVPDSYLKYNGNSYYDK